MDSADHPLRSFGVEVVRQYGRSPFPVFPQITRSDPSLQDTLNGEVESPATVRDAEPLVQMKALRRLGYSY